VCPSFCGGNLKPLIKNKTRAYKPVQHVSGIRKKITCNNILLLTKHNDNKPYGFRFKFQWLFLVLNGFSMTIEFTAECSVRKTLSINFPWIWVVIFKNDCHPTEPFSKIFFWVSLFGGVPAPRLCCSATKIVWNTKYIKREENHILFSGNVKPWSHSSVSLYPARYFFFFFF